MFAQILSDERLKGSTDAETETEIGTRPERERESETDRTKALLKA